MKKNIGSESRFLPTPPAFDRFDAPAARRNFAMPFGAQKIEWRCYPMVKKI